MDSITGQVVWRRVGGNCIEWTVSGQDALYDPPMPFSTTYHCNRYATFFGPAEGEGYFGNQVHGRASSVWRQTDTRVTHNLMKKYLSQGYAVNPDYVPEINRKG